MVAAGLIMMFVPSASPRHQPWQILYTNRPRTALAASPTPDNMISGLGNGERVATKILAGSIIVMRVRGSLYLIAIAGDEMKIYSGVGFIMGGNISVIYDSV